MEGGPGTERCLSGLADTCEPPPSAERSAELLAEAKRRGDALGQERLYGYMAAHYLQVLRCPAAFGRLSAHEREHVLARRMDGTRVLAVAETGESPSEHPPAERRLFFLHPEQRQWEVLGLLPPEVPARGFALCTLNNYLFVAGGLGSSGPSDRVTCFNPLTGAWSPVRPLLEPRCRLRLVALDGQLYALGGECLLSAERYDPRADRWSRVAPLPGGSFAVAHEAAACGGGLYVSGGSLLYRLLRYEPRRDDWAECPFSRSRGRSADMVARGSLVYRFDVARGERAQVSVHRYDTVVKAWLEDEDECAAAASSPQQLREALPFRCAVLRDRIYCVSRSHTLQFQVRDDDGGRGAFLPEVLPSPPATRGALEPFILSLRLE